MNARPSYIIHFIQTFMTASIYYRQKHIQIINLYYYYYYFVVVSFIVICFIYNIRMYNMYILQMAICYCFRVVEKLSV